MPKGESSGFPDNIGAILRATRESLGLTRETFAERVGVTPETIKNLENGKYLSPRTARDALDALNILLQKRGKTPISIFKYPQIQKTDHSELNESKPQGPTEFEAGRFIQIRIAHEEESQWRDLTSELPEWLAEANVPGENAALWRQRFSKKEFLSACERFFWTGTFGTEDPIFDGVFVNESNHDFIIMAVGVEIIAAHHHMHSAGEPNPIPVPVVAEYRFAVPLLWSAEDPNQIKASGKFPLTFRQVFPDPLFASPGTAFRYNLKLERARHEMVNAMLIRLMVETSKGTVKSDLIYLQN